MSKIQITLRDENCDDWYEIEETLTSSDGAGEFVPLEEFKYKKTEVFLEVINPFSYRPGHVDQYVERDGVVWLIDDLNEDEAILLGVSKIELLKKAEQFK